MKLILAVLIPLTAVIDLACFLIIFVMPHLIQHPQRARGDWPVNLGLAFVGVSVGVVLVAVLGTLMDVSWKPSNSRFQLLCLLTIVGYVLFTSTYLWRLLNGGI